MDNLIVTLTGPSCSGKTTLSRRLVKAGFAELVSTTTRLPREGEQDGVDYYFIDKSQFKRLKAQGSFVETVEFAGNFYGVSVKEVQARFASGKPIVIVVEPDGAGQIATWAAANNVRHVSVYVGNKVDTLLERMVNRIQADAKTPAIIYTRRIRNLIETELNWRWARDWDIVASEFAPGESEAKLFDQITALVSPPVRRPARRPLKKAA